MERHTDRLHYKFERGVRPHGPDCEDYVRSAGIFDIGLRCDRLNLFHHPAPNPSLSSVDIGSITQTSAVATVTIEDAGDAQKTVHVRYRIEGTDSWSEPTLTASTYGASASIDITGLTENTKYEVQASLDSAFGVTVSTTFTTQRYPSLSGIDVTDITKTTARAEIDIADPDDKSQTVYLRYRTTPQGDWSSTLTTTAQQQMRR